MSACNCCPHTREEKPLAELQNRPTLFNWVTVLLLTGWVGIVTFAVETAGPENLSAVPTLEAFLRTLL